MRQTDLAALRVVQMVERIEHEKLIERAATVGLTPQEIEKSMNIERNWKNDQETDADLLEFGGILDHDE
ncbi:MAG: hypothetical protein FGM44_14455 [Limnohabitans sp.]|nr:hypothetical protein [Limnohabitans sp.]